MINFNVPPVVDTALDYMAEAIKNRKISGDGVFTKKCSTWFEMQFHVPRVLLTTSCTHALEMSALLLDIQKGDEVIMPSYTFVSTANAFVLRGAKIKFIDIRPDTLNMDESLIEQAITKQTKVIVPVHYAGVACEMDTINAIAKSHGLKVVEDAAQGVNAFYKGKALGTLGEIGCYSFHETKNYSMGEGGAVVINNPQYIARAEIIREKGTNRSQFFKGEVDKYTWVDQGSSYLPSDLNAAYLYAQLLEAQTINSWRMHCWHSYHEGLKSLEEQGLIQRPIIPEGCQHNGHMYAIRVKDMAERDDLIQYLKAHQVWSVFHYVPLHSSNAGRKWGEFVGEDVYTTRESERLLRLPLYYSLKEEEIAYIIRCIESFFEKR